MNNSQKHRSNTSKSTSNLSSNTSSTIPSTIPSTTPSAIPTSTNISPTTTTAISSSITTTANSSSIPTLSHSNIPSHNKKNKKPRKRKQKEYFQNILNKEVHNISSYTLTNKQLSVLSLGLNHIPTPKTSESTKKRLIQEFDEYANKIRLKKQLINLNTDKNPTNNIKSAYDSIKNKYSNKAETITSNKIQQGPLETYLQETRQKLINEIKNINLNSIKKYNQNNNNSIILEEIKNLKSNKNIIITSADKNLGVCITDKSWYDNECLRQLSDRNSYQELTYEPDYKRIMTKLKRLLVSNNLCYTDKSKSKLTSIASCTVLVVT